MHEAIQLMSKTLAIHLPHLPKEALKQATVESVSPIASEPIPEALVQQEPETPAQQTSNPSEDPVTPNKATIPTTEQESSPEAQPIEAPTTTPKRPTHVKRKSVILTIGSYLWPFGASAPKNVDVKVDTVEISSDEVQVDGAKKDTAPGPELSKAVSTVSLSDVAVPAVNSV